MLPITLKSSHSIQPTPYLSLRFSIHKVRIFITVKKRLRLVDCFVALTATVISLIVCRKTGLPVVVLIGY